MNYQWMQRKNTVAHSRKTVRVLSILILAAGFVLSSPSLWSQQAAQTQTEGWFGPAACDVSGTWYGGGDATKYLMTIVPRPGPGDSYTAIGDGAYSLAALGYPVKTTWSNTLVRRHGHRPATYDVYGIGMVNNNAGFPAPSPDIQAVHGIAYLVDCNTLKFDYDFFGGYFWPTDKIPLLSPPDYVVVPPPFSETYRRMPTKCTQCTSN